METKTKIVVITADDAGRRMDNYLFSELKHVPKSRIYRAIRKGEVRVNKKRIKVEYKLQLEDQVRIPPISQPEQAPAVRPSNNLVDLLQQRILYEDDKILVLNKPSGIAVHGGSGIQLGVIEALRVIYPKLALELVHRLDRETSGCLIIAKRRSALRNMHAQMREGQVHKIYQCLVKGWLGKPQIRVDKPLYKNQLASGERFVKIDLQQGKPSATKFKEIERFEQTSLIEADLETGRTHQIRVHAQSLGCFLAGDDKYGDKDFDQKMKALGLKRLFLHAMKITFKLPGSDEVKVISAPLDVELLDVLKRLREQRKL